MVKRKTVKTMTSLTLRTLYVEVKQLERKLTILEQRLASVNPDQVQPRNSPKTFDEIVKAGRAFAKSRKLNEEDVVRIIHESRSVPYD